MCGLWGFVGPGNADSSVLRATAALAAKRGPDSWGITTETVDQRGMGRLMPQHVDAVPPSRVVVGHCRLSTVLGTKNAAACQPIRSGRFVVAHNGSVLNASTIVRRMNLRPVTGNDSEVLALLLDSLQGHTAERLSMALDMVDHGDGYALALLDLSTMDVMLRARGIPLWSFTGSGGTYWCSLKLGTEWEPVHA